MVYEYKLGNSSWPKAYSIVMEALRGINIDIVWISHMVCSALL